MKKVLIGICGGIASYKAINIISNLVQEGYEVEVVLSNNAHNFVATIVIESLIKRKVHQDLFTEPLVHTALAYWCDLMVIVPATYNVVGKIAAGIADNLLTTIVSAVNKQVILALAMNENMYNNPIFKHNVTFLSQMGYKFIEADEGFLACNKYGKGRLKPEEEILKVIKEYFSNNLHQNKIVKHLEYQSQDYNNSNQNILHNININDSEFVGESDNFYEALVGKIIDKKQENTYNTITKDNIDDEIVNINFVNKNKKQILDNFEGYSNNNHHNVNNKNNDIVYYDFENLNQIYQKCSFNEDLKNKNIIITAGKTLEYIDPVRYISSPSSGKMGWHLALECQKRGANVFLIIGENQLPKIEGIQTITVISADDMYREVIKLYEWSDIVIATAAVSDYKVKAQAINKIKKQKDQQGLNLELVENVDIIKELGKNKGDRILIGFCLETINLEESALQKLKSKNLDFIVANSNNNLSSNGGDFYIINHNYKQAYTNITKANMATVIVDHIVNISHSEGYKFKDYKCENSQKIGLNNKNFKNETLEIKNLKKQK